MNEYEWNPLWIVGLKETETARACEMTYRERARQSSQRFVDVLVLKEWG